MAAAVALLLAATLLVSLALPLGAFADELDDARKGSVKVFVVTADKDRITGGSLRAYQVASRTDGAYVPLPGYERCGLDLGKSEFTKEDAETVSAFVSANDAQYVTSPVSETGTAFFGELGQGLYLIAQNEKAPGFLPIVPFLVLVPAVIDGRIVYDVTCSPKPVEREPDCEIPLIAEKQVTNAKTAKAPADTPFSFVLTPEKKGQPMPAGSDGTLDPETGAITVTRKGPGEVDFGKFGFMKADAGKTYVYTLREIKGTAQNYKYDTTIFTVTVSVTAEGDAVKCEMTLKDEGGKAYNKAVFHNTYSDPPPSVPSTGQLWWPAAVLAALGLIFMIAGLASFRRRERV